ncbi:MAG: lipopolysaccharide transport periplasmic protein LptA [Methylobacteriaceae bacterium]|nr:lipopolysaccharide transport periplasmic protein LptA [Methylobacteriaceae bacterium]
MTPRLVIAALAALALGAPAALAQAAKPAAPAAKPAAAAAKPGAAKGGVAILPGGNSKEPVNIEANKLEWFDKDQKAVYTGDVVVVQGETSLRAAVLTIFLARDERAPTADAGGAPSGNSQIRRMEATGPVTVIQKDQIGTGDRGEYDKAANKVYLIGNVTLSQGPNITTGERLVYDLDTKQAVVESGGGGKKRVQGIFVPGSGGKDAEPGKSSPKAAETGKNSPKTAAPGKPTELAPKRTP